MTDPISPLTRATAQGPVGRPLTRVDGPAKVTGAATYAAEFAVPDLAHAAIVPAAIPSGRVTAIDTTMAEKMPGVLAVLTHLNAPRLPYHVHSPKAAVDPDNGERLHVLQGPEVVFTGQPVALVVAGTHAQAMHAADLVRVTYAADSGATRFEDAAKQAHAPGQSRGETGESGPSDTLRGDPDQELTTAEVAIDVIYDQPVNIHAAMEPHATIAQWRDGKLTLWDKTQWVSNVRAEIASIFGMEGKDIRVISPFVGGAFGSSLRTWPHVTLAAMAARVTGRPVRLELTRRQNFMLTGYRPRTIQRIALGARSDGRLLATVQEAVGQTSLYEDYSEPTTAVVPMLYDSPHMRATYRLAPMAASTPCPMRAPGVITGNLALEMAMDELAWKAGIDPVELRLRNHADKNPNTGLPWSSKSLKECYRLAAERFGWAERVPQVRSMEADGKLVGYGMATAAYPTHRSRAMVAASLHANGTGVIRTAGSDMGPGTYTSCTQVAAEAMGLPPERVRVDLGDTDLPWAPVHGGSITMASVGSAILAACTELRAQLLLLALSDAQSPLQGCDAAGTLLVDGRLVRRDDPARGETVEEILRRNRRAELSVTAEARPGAEQKQFSMYAFGAVFAEVRVDPDLGEVRVPRMVGAYGCGRIINPRTAHSQAIGGLMQGLGMALMEQGEWDDNLGRVMNANLAEYLVPVCADTPDLDVSFVDEDDPHVNPLGVKGLAEIAIVGAVPAIANAVFHATGVRVRSLPITPDKLIG